MHKILIMLIIGIAGGTGSGKTTLVNRLLQKLDAKQVGLLSQDSYYNQTNDLSPEERTTINFDHPDSIDFDLLIQHLKEFADVLSNFDNIIIAPIYPAREENIWNVKESDLVNLIKEKNPNVIYLDSFDKIEKHIKEKVSENDLVITIGAGPVNEVAKNLVKE